MEELRISPNPFGVLERCLPAGLARHENDFAQFSRNFRGDDLFFG